MKTNNKGFSLVELIVVIAIMAILAAVAIPTFAGFITKANKASDESFMNDLEYAVTLSYLANPNEDPGTITVTVANGTVSSITYGDVTISKTGDKWGGTCSNASCAVVSHDNVAEVVGSVDFGYTFKHVKAGTITIADGVVTFPAN